MKGSVGDYWIDHNGRTVKILRPSGYQPNAWWCEDVDMKSQSVIDDNDLKKLLKAAHLPYTTTSSVYKTPEGSYDVVTGPISVGVFNSGVCRHEWVDAGFHFSVWCCKHCNVDKPKE